MEDLLFGLEHSIAEINYTSESKINGSRSLINHVCVSGNLFDLITNYSVQNDVENMSNHNAIMLKLDISDLLYITKIQPRL
jgi:hypothetical protein